MQTKTEMEYKVWLSKFRHNNSVSEHYMCKGTGEVWVKTLAGMHIAFVVKPNKRG